MRKIPAKLENPIDNIMYDSSSILAPYFKQLNFSANGITSLSLLTGLLSINFLCNDQYELSALMFMVSYLFDCMDGFYARKYKIVSDFGDWYDHIKDVVIFSILAYCILQKIESTRDRVILIIVLCALFLLMSVHVGCQQKISDKNGAGVLDNLQFLCQTENVEDFMGYSRFFGNGTFIASTVLVIYLLKYYNTDAQNTRRTRTSD